MTRAARGAGGGRRRRQQRARKRTATEGEVVPGTHEEEEVDAQEPGRDGEDVLDAHAAEGALLGGVADLHPRDACEQRVGEERQRLVEPGDELFHVVFAEGELLQSFPDHEWCEYRSNQLCDQTTNGQSHAPRFDKQAQCHRRNEGTKNVCGNYQENGKCRVPSSLHSTVSRTKPMEFQNVKITALVKMTEYAIAHGVQKKIIIPFLNSTGSSGMNVVRNDPSSDVITIIDVIP